VAPIFSQVLVGDEMVGIPTMEEKIMSLDAWGDEGDIGQCDGCGLDHIECRCLNEDVLALDRAFADSAPSAQEE